MASRTPTTTEAELASQTAGRISKGAADPACIRSSPTVVGSRSRAAVLSTTNMAMWLVATPGVEESLFSSCMALMPRGVAALPSPSRLAEMFIEMAPMAGPAGSRPGKASRVRGERARLMMWVSPAFSATFISPHHRHMVPVRVITISTAAPQSFIKAADTASILPQSRATTIPNRIIAQKM